MTPPQRTVAQWLSERLPPPLFRSVISTSAPLSLELLSALQLYSEVGELGKELLKRNGHQKLNASYIRFRSYMRQAISFFQAAGELPYRASPLLYYYSFMNIVKAAIFLRDPSFPFGHIHHGLSPGRSRNVLSTSSVNVVVPGVFSHFYRHVTGVPAPRTKFTIPALLAYISDVAAEYQMFKLGQPKSVACRYAITRCMDQQGFHGMIVVPRRGEQFDKRVSELLKSGFSELNLDQNSLRTVFDIAGEVRHGFSIWETRKEYPFGPNNEVPASEIVHDTAQALSGHISYIPFDEVSRFTLNLKIGPGGAVIMNEMLAIYAVMFFLGSTVRYRPEILEGMLSRKDAWIIESIIRSTPLTFLRHVRNFLDGQYLAYRER